MTTTDPTDLEREYRAAVALTEELQRRLTTTTKDAPEREELKAKLVAAVDRARQAKEKQKHATQRQVFAGLQTPLAEAMRARLDPVLVGELEANALARQAERDRKGEERRAAKAAATPQAAPPTTPAEPPAPPSPRTLVAQAPEVYHVVPRASTSRLVASAPPTPRPSPPPRPPSRGREVADAFREAGRR
jgi:hypothetical protein